MLCLLLANIALIKILTPMGIIDITILIFYLMMFFFSLAAKNIFSKFNILIFVSFLLFWLCYKYFYIETRKYTDNYLGSSLIIVGISYLGFKLLHFYIDYRNDDIPKKDILYFINWCLFFPSILAGPMMRYQSWRSQVTGVRVKLSSVSYGFERIIIGLFFKLVLANNLYYYTLGSMLAGMEIDEFSINLVLFALIYPVYLFFDFAGYTHIAIGAGLMLGLKLPENFLNPLLSRNLIQFWREWHITLSELLKDYLFVPISIFLARKKIHGKAAKIVIPTLLTFAFAGIWHGSGLNFLIFGVLHGVGIIFLQLFNTQIVRLKLPHILAWFINYLYISLTFIFFDLQFVQILNLFK
jgi:D-alanyl-lipoteichoic acid acyltransferase DltB (MBOAT superfamily)